MLKVGDKISARITVDSFDGQTKQAKIGCVTYVHPKGWYCQATFQIGPKRWRKESFQLVNGLPLPSEAQIIND
jgi:hypothetical protein